MRNLFILCVLIISFSCKKEIDDLSLSENETVEINHSDSTLTISTNNFNSLESTLKSATDILYLDELITYGINIEIEKEIYLSEISGSSMKIPKNYNLVFVNGGKLILRDNDALTINGGIEAGFFKIFETTSTSKIDGSPIINKVYPQWWGATTNDGTDDRIAINSAINTFNNPTVCFPSGTYNLNTTDPEDYAASFPIEIHDLNGISLEGEGNGAIIATNINNRVMIDFKKCHNISINNLTFKGRVFNVLENNKVESYTRSHIGIRFNSETGDFSGSKNISIRNCTFEGFYSGALIIQKALDVDVMNNTFQKNTFMEAGDYYGAIHLKAPISYANITNNKILDFLSSGIGIYSFNETDPVENITITNNYIKANIKSIGTMGIYAPQGIKNSIISNNTILDVWNEGIVLNSGNIAVRNNIISSNYIYAGYTGITINLDEAPSLLNANVAKNNTISSNIIRGKAVNGNQANHGIIITNNESTIITDNNIKDFESSGIFSKESYLSNISNNIISNTGYSIQLIRCDYLMVTNNILKFPSKGKYINIENSTNSTIKNNSTINEI